METLFCHRIVNRSNFTSATNPTPSPISPKRRKVKQLAIHMQKPVCLRINN